MNEFYDTLKQFARAGIMPSTLEEVQDNEVVHLLKAARTDKDATARRVEGWLESEIAKRSGMDDGELQYVKQPSLFDDFQIHPEISEPVAKSQVPREEIASEIAKARKGDVVVFQKASALGLYSPTERMVVESIDMVTGDVSGRTLSGQVERVGRSTPLRRLEVQATGDMYDSYRNTDRMGGFGFSMDRSRELSI